MIADEEYFVATVLSYDPGGQRGEDYDGATIEAYDFDFNSVHSWGDYGRPELLEYKSLGKPLTTVVSRASLA